MNTKKIINEFININNDLINEWNQMKHSLSDKDDLFSQFTELLKRSHFNNLFSIVFSTLLQLTDKKEILDTYSLNDIERFLKRNIENNFISIDELIELIHFEHSVMDNRIEAKKYLKIARNRISEMTIELDEIEKSI